MDTTRPRVQSSVASQALPAPYAALALGVVVTVACVVGTLSRPLEFLATFWPANALMLGMLLREPSLARDPRAWLACVCAYVFSSLLMGDGMAIAIWLSFANLAGVVAGWQFFHGLDRSTMLLRGPLSSLFLLCGCIVQAAAESIVGFSATPVLFGGSAREALLMWFSSALMCSMIVLPVVLSAPSLEAIRRFRCRAAMREFDPSRLAPLLALIASEGIALLLGGAGSLLFSVPALLWCSLRYSLFSTALLCLAVGLATSYSATMGIVNYTPEHLPDVLSLRLGITMLSLGPLSVASFQAVRNELLDKLNYAARHDALTGVFGRKTFLDQSARSLHRLSQDQRSAAVLMIDLDHFKRVNDNFGHAAGDELLRGFTRVMQQELRPTDLLGRMGGEEFAVLLPDVTKPEAEAIAQRLCDTTRTQQFHLGNNEYLNATVSVGLIHQLASPQRGQIERLLREADLALYEAKRTGRNRVMVHA